MTISNLPIPQDDPQGHPLRKTRKPGPAHSNSHIKKPFLRPTEECSHSTHTGHRVDASHFHHNPPISIPVKSFPKAILASLIADDNLQPYIHYIYF